MRPSVSSATPCRGLSGSSTQTSIRIRGFSAAIATKAATYTETA